MKSKKFILRRVNLEDAKNLFEYQQESDTKKNFMSIPKSIKEVKKEIKSQIKENHLNKHKRTSDSFVIDVDGKAIGKIGVHDIVYGHKAISSSWVAKPFRGKGIGTEAHKRLIKYVFKTYNLKRLQGNVRTFNKASAKMLEKAGYKLEGILRKNKLKNGKFMDDMVYAIVK